MVLRARAAEQLSDEQERIGKATTYARERAVASLPVIDHVSQDSKDKEQRKEQRRDSDSYNLRTETIRCEGEA